MTDEAEQLQILLVDDDDVDRELVVRALVRSGLSANIREAADGKTALEIWRQASFDCVFLDYQMQGMNGMELFHELQQRSGDRVVPAIFLTGHGSETLAVEVIEAGALDYVPKDEITPPVLRRAVRYALARQHSLLELNRLANLDSLTGLSNRTLFLAQVEKGIAVARRTNDRIALLLLDLDHFKTVNDTLGHLMGDQLLRQAAQRLKGVARASDTVARLGGDEFAILSNVGQKSENATALAERILQELEKPYDLDGQQWFLTASIGIGVCDQDGDEVNELLKNADLALYWVKAKGRDSYRFYHEALNEQAQERRRMEVALRRALEEDQLDLYYQPRVDAATGGVVGVEALIRWHDAERGWVAPSEFIPLAEATRLIVSIGEWVLRRACAQCAAWHRVGVPGLFVSVNVSPVELQTGNIVDVVLQVLDETGLDPACLEIEITEGAVMANYACAVDALEALARAGVSVAIDDFGTGYSSLGRLHTLPVHKLKIDQSFVRDLNLGGDRAPIVDVIISLGQQLNLAVVAEGAEDAAAFKYLANAGCQEIQGYYIGRPLPADRFLAWWHESSGRVDAATPRSLQEA